MKDTGLLRAIGAEGEGVIVHGVDTLALRLAAAGGRIDDLPASQLVAAGFTLLQRSAPLVRLLAGRRAGILLPAGPAALVALAASDGRGAVLLPSTTPAPDIAARCAAHEVGAVFTTAALRALVPSSLARVLLDEAPRIASVCLPDGREQIVDLGSHVGLTVEGEIDVPGRDEECLLLPTDPTRWLSHREVLHLDVLADLSTSQHGWTRNLSRLLIDLLSGGTFPP